VRLALLVLLLASCHRASVSPEQSRALIEEALAGPSALLHGLCPEAPPTHESFTGLTDVRLTVLSQEGPRLRAVVSGVPLAPTEDGELLRAALRCEGEIEVAFARTPEPSLEQIWLRRGRRPGATFR
jgi:hypothetical protein